MTQLQIARNSTYIENFELDFQINWHEYIGHYILGARHFLLKEKPESLPRARVVLQRLYIMDKIASIIFYGLILWLLYSYWSCIIYSFECVLDKTTGYLNHRWTRITTNE